jgi:hypothetical protein
MTVRKAKFVWKYRRPLWKYRKLVAHRREIAGAAIAGATILALVVLKLSAAKRASLCNAGGLAAGVFVPK